MIPVEQLKIMVVGATGGLGREVARELAAHLAPGHLVLAGRDLASVTAESKRLSAVPLQLDLASLVSVKSAVQALTPAGTVGPVDVVVANAAVQLPGGPVRTRDGYETAFQVNFLAQLDLVDRLLSSTQAPSRVVFVGSASHDPGRTSLPGPRLDDLAEVAVDDLTDVGAGMRRYATSKLLVTAAALGLARERPGCEVVCFDPGAMLETGLYRGQSTLARLSMRVSAPLAQRRPGFSTARRSGKALAALAISGHPGIGGSVTINPDGSTTAVSATAASADYQDRVLQQGRRLLSTAA